MNERVFHFIIAGRYAGKTLTSEKEIKKLIPSAIINGNRVHMKAAPKNCVSAEEQYLLHLTNQALSCSSIYN